RDLSTPSNPPGRMSGDDLLQATRSSIASARRPVDGPDQRIDILGRCPRGDAGAEVEDVARRLPGGLDDRQYGALDCSRVGQQRKRIEIALQRHAGAVALAR